MTRRATYILTALIFTAIMLSSPAVAKEGKLNEPPKGFTALFSGQDFAGWKVSEKNAEHWKIADGVIVYDGKGSSLPTEKQYSDFELYVDWKIEKGGDSGIYLRGQPQVQIWNRKEGSGGLWNNKKTHVGEKPLVAADKPVGEWNTLECIAYEDQITVKLNGTLVNKATAVKPGKGRIQIQSEAAEVFIRRVELTPLSDK